MSGTAIFSLSDKVLYDALNQYGVTNDALRHIFLTRGIVISAKTDRKVLAKHFSRLVHDYQDYRWLAELLEPTSRRDRLTSKLIRRAVTNDDFEHAAQELKKAIDEEGDKASVVRHRNGNIDIRVTYTEANFNKNVFKQTVSRTAVITIENIGSKDGTTVRHPQTKKVSDWAAALLKLLKERVQGDLDVLEIDLRHITSSKLRTEFFTRLIDSVEGFKRVDVTDVYVANPRAKKAADGEADLGTHISKASLKGEGVLESKELNSLGERFFMSKIIWHAVRDDPLRTDVYEFEAQFSEPETFTEFSYLARCFFRRSESGELFPTRNPISQDEEKSLNRVLERAALRSAGEVSSSGINQEQS